MNTNQSTNKKLLDVAERFGTPAYVYDMQVIGERIEELRECVGVYPKTEFLYAVKANFNPYIVKYIIERGCGIDAVSLEEAMLALACGCRKENILFTGNNMTDDEMNGVHKIGILLNIGSLSRLEKFGKAHPGSDVCVRFNPNIGIASHESNITGGPDSKFGISFRDVRKVLEIADKHSLKIIGVHQHIGSGWLRLREPILALDVILEIAKKISGLKFVDVGGGLGVPYKPEENRLDARLLGDQINKRFRAFCNEYGSELTLRFEPGRYIVAESGRLLTRVNTIKESISRKVIVGTDTGMHHLARVALYGSFHPISNISNSDGMLLEYDVTGNICECADFFARNRMMPQIHEGDVLSIDIAGAYGMSMSSNYQFRGRPPEVAIEGDEIKEIRRRENFDDLVSFYGL